MSRLRTLLLVGLVLAPVAGCGKKALPDPPDPKLNTFPRTYPSNNGDPRDTAATTSAEPAKPDDAKAPSDAHP